MFWWATDIHCTQEGDTYYEPWYGNGIANYEAFATAVNAAAPDAVFITGDIANKSIEMVSTAGSITRTINNALPIIGNNDLGIGGTSLAGYTAQKTACLIQYEMQSDHYTRDYGFCRVVVLNGNYNENEQDFQAEGSGYITAEQLLWLQDQLDTGPDAVLVLIHHAPSFRIINHDALYEILQSRDNVFVFAGHEHPAHVVISNSAVPEWIGPTVFNGKYCIVSVGKSITGSISVTVNERSLL